MPMNLARSDRRLLLWAAAIFLPLVLALAIMSAGQQESEVPSSYSYDSQGAMAAFLLLQDEGYRVERWEQSPTALPAEAANTVLVLASPFNAPSRDERNSLQLYLSRGGRILAAGYTASFFVPRAEAVPELIGSPDWRNFEPQLLSALTRGGPIRMTPAAYWKNDSPPVLVHYADGERPVVVSYKVGKGEVIWWASATPLSNAGISAGGNLQLFLNALGDKATVRVLWDEYFHGYRKTLKAYMAEPPLAFGLVQCFLLLVAVFLTFSRRSLPIHPAEEKPRLSPLEFVETLGGLYRRAHASHAALEMPYMRFRSMAARRLGLRPDIAADDLARSLRTRFGYKDESLSGLLRRIEAALAQDAPAEDAVLKLTQELNHHMQNLKFVQETSIHGERVPGAPARAK